MTIPFESKHVTLFSTIHLSLLCLMCGPFRSTRTCNTTE